MSTLAEKTPAGGATALAGTTAAPLKVLIADDHPLVIVGIRRTLEGHEDIEVAGEAHSASELLAQIARRKPDVVLMDLRMPDADGASCIAQITETWPHVKVIVLSACDDSAAIDTALAAGASSYVVKSVKAIDLASVLRQAHSGAIYHAPSGNGNGNGSAHAEERAGSTLTEREMAILRAVAKGLTTSSISRELWISEHTVKFHLTNIYRKLGVSNRSGAVRYALEHGLAG